jgi:hypothetical protein
MRSVFPPGLALAAALLGALPPSPALPSPSSPPCHGGRGGGGRGTVCVCVFVCVCLFVCENNYNTRKYVPITNDVASDREMPVLTSRCRLVAAT